jgi:hypothetical protein
MGLRVERPEQLKLEERVPMTMAVVVAIMIGVLASTRATAKQKSQRQHAAAAGDLASPEQELGKFFRVSADDLPAPKARRSPTARSAFLSRSNPQGSRRL